MGLGRWNPTRITRFIRGISSSAHTAIVETDQGLAYVKAMGGREGPHTLAGEVLGVQLAEWFSLDTFDAAILDHNGTVDIELFDSTGEPFGLAKEGPAFITRAEEGSQWSGSKRDLRKLVNPQDLSRLVVFDTWLLNCDRYRPGVPGKRRARINRDNVFFSEEGAPAGQWSLKAMDHTHILLCGAAWTKKLSHLERVREDGLYGIFPEFRDFLLREHVRAAADHLKTITPRIVAGMLARIPEEWEVSAETGDAVQDLLVQRAAYVAETIENRVWPQGELFAEESQ